MSFLAPLYALGLLAVAAPLIFHLIRRAPKGRVPFSSLMFLSPSPPRFTRRSRLDQWLLFLLRAAALCLLALAFMRPFLRLEGSPDPGAGDGQRVAVLIDTSASMRRGDLWQRAVAEAEAVLANAHPTDEVALFAFDLSARPLLGFREAAALEPSQRRAVAADRLRALEPGWGGTDLGRALLDAVAAVNDAAASDGQAGARARRIVLVSDLQQGARLEALASAEWPADVELEVKTLTAEGDNAGLGLLAERPEDERAGGAADLRVRLFNDAGSQQPQFTLSWADAGEGAAQAVEAYVPPGESRVVRVPRPPEGASWRLLRLKGDAHPFDNTLFVAAPLREEVTVVYLGDDPPDDPEGLRYYLDRGLGAMPGRSVTVLSPRPGEGLTWEALRPVPLAVVSGETTPANAGLLRRYLDEGGTVLYVATAPGRAETLAALAGVPVWDVEEARVDRYAMLREIDFAHPLFAPLAGPQFSDFTKVHFWKYRRLGDGRLGDARAVARFESGDPAVLDKAVGKGRLFVLASGWQPEDSQLARSSKFVPLLAAVLERRLGRRPETPHYLVGDRVPLPAVEGVAEGTTVRKPDGSAVPLSPGAKFFEGTERPGVYTLERAGGGAEFAVNLDPRESLTSPTAVESLEQMGCRLAGRAPRGDEAERLRQMRDIELEGRQKVWRWLVLAVIGVLLAETWLAGRRSRARPAGAEAVKP